MIDESEMKKESIGQMDEQHGDSLIDAYALGALEPEDVAILEAHLEHCIRCQQLVADARASTQMLLYSVPLVEPPPGLRAKVLARVHAEATGGNGVAAGQPAPIADAKHTDQGWDRVRRFMRVLFGTVPPPQSDPAAALLSELLAAPDSIVWDLAGTNDAPSAKARLVGKPDGRDAVIVASGLRHLSADEAYQVWFLRGGKPLPNVLFTVAGGQGHQVVRAPRRLRDFEVVAITPEPAAGSPAPTGPIVLMGELSA